MAATLDLGLGQYQQAHLDLNLSGANHHVTPQKTSENSDYR